MATLTKEQADAHKLIPEINAHYREFKKAASDGLKNAIKIGELLLRMKKALPHGEFTSEVERRCDFSPEWGRLCMKVASGKDTLATIEEKPESVREAAKLISEYTPRNKGENGTRSSVLKSTSQEPATTSENSAENEPESETEESDDPIGDACTHEWDEDDCCKHCKMENPDKPEPVTDAFGKAVPESLHDVFGESKKWQQAMSFVSSAKGAVTEIKGHRAAMHLDSAELDRLLSQARTNLKFAAPHTECVKCRRKIKPDCPHCRGEGWLNKATYTSIASEADIAWQENRK